MSQIKGKMKKAIRVLHVFGVLDRGGAESMIMNIYRKIDKKTIQFDFVIHTMQECDYSNEVIKLGGKIFSAPKFEVSQIKQYKKWWKSFLLEHKNDYKAIHIHMRSTASLYIPIAKDYHIKTIIHSHSISDGKGFEAYRKKVLQFPLRFQADYLFACSVESAEWLFGKRVQNRTNFYILKNSIDLDVFTFSNSRREQIREELGIQPDEFIICHVGNFTKAKNHSFLIDVFYEFRKLKKGKLLLVGADNEKLRDGIENKIAEFKLKNDVLLLGSRSDVPSILSASDVFVFPSQWEGFAVSVLEAQAIGLNCYISDKIPKEVILTDLVHVLPLNNDGKMWAKHIINNRVDSPEAHNQIKESGYDVNRNVSWITDFYLSC